MANYIGGESERLEFENTRLRRKFDLDDELLAEFAQGIRRSTLEEAALFIETHGVVTSKWDVQGNPEDYKVYERNKHPFDPLAHAIRGLAAGGA